MHRSFSPPDGPAPDGRPATGPHLLDVSMFWGASSGVRRVLTARHERMRALGWRHTVVAPGARGPGLIDCGGLPLPAGGGCRVVLGTGRAVRQMTWVAPDIIEAADPYTLGWAALKAAEQLQVPAVAFCHSDLPPWACGRWARRYLVNLYSHFDAVLAPSRGLAQRLQAWGVPRVSVQPLGVDCAVFTPCARDMAWRRAFCTTHGLAPETRLLACTGRFAPENNLQLLADAVALLGPGHQLVAVGDGPSPPVGHHVLRLRPEADDHRLARLVASCDAYVHAGDPVTLGLGVLEAMACGTPVVTADAGALAELTQGAGLLVRRPRAGDWADAMQATLSGHQAALRRTALARAQAQDWPQVLLQMTRRHAALIGLGTTPSQAPLAQPLAAGAPARWSPLARQR